MYTFPSPYSCFSVWIIIISLNTQAPEILNLEKLPSFAGFLVSLTTIHINSKDLLWGEYQYNRKLWITQEKIKFKVEVTSYPANINRKVCFHLNNGSSVNVCWIPDKDGAKAVIFLGWDARRFLLAFFLRKLLQVTVTFFLLGSLVTWNWSLSLAFDSFFIIICKKEIQCARDRHEYNPSLNVNLLFPSFLNDSFNPISATRCWSCSPGSKRVRKEISQKALQRF